MDVEVYFANLKEKYGSTETLSGLIDKKKEDYLKIHDDLSEKAQERYLKSIESRIRVEYEIHLIHEDPEFKPLFDLVKEHAGRLKEEEEVRISEETDGIKPILENFARTLRKFKTQLDGLKLENYFPKKK